MCRLGDVLGTVQDDIGSCSDDILMLSWDFWEFSTTSCSNAFFAVYFSMASYTGAQIVSTLFLFISTSFPKPKLNLYTGKPQGKKAKFKLCSENSLGRPVCHKRPPILNDYTGTYIIFLAEDPTFQSN